MKKKYYSGLAMASAALAFTMPCSADLDSVIPQASELQLYRQAADDGDPRGMNQMGKCYLLGTGVEKDFSKAEEFFKKGADLGDKACRHNLAVRYMDRGLYKEAVDLFIENAQAGFPAAEWMVGQSYLIGRVLEADTAEAFRWLSLAYEHGDKHACRELGMLYLGLHGVMQDMEKAISLFEEADAQGDVMARMYLYCAAASGYKTKWSAAEADAEFEKIRKQRWEGTKKMNDIFGYDSSKDTSATLADLAHIFRGMVEKQDDAAVEAWCRIWKGFVTYGMPNEKVFYQRDGLAWLTLLAEKGKASAWRMKGGFLEDRVDSDFLAAHQWAKECFRRAAEMGDAEGAYEYAKSLVEFTKSEDEVDVAEVRKWTKMAADAGYYLAVAAQASCYEKGDLGTPKDMAKAEEYYKKGMELGDDFCADGLGRVYAGSGKISQACQAWTTAALLARSSNYQGQLEAYLVSFADKGEPAALVGLGKIREKQGKLSEAADYYQKAADKGYPEAEGLYCLCCFYGKGRAQDLKEGEKWAKLAAEHGDAVGQTEYASALLNGDNGPKNHEKALEWYLKAAAQGYARAQFEAGVCLALGEGTAPNPQEALQWIEKAAKNGHAGAHAALADFYLEGLWVPLNEPKAYQLFLESLKLGSPKGYYGAGKCLVQGKGCEADVQQGLRALAMAAQMGHRGAAEYLQYLHDLFKKSTVPAVMCDYAVALLTGNTMQEDQAAGWKLMEKAAAQGEPRAQFQMAEFLEKQSGKQTEAEALLTKSAENSYLPAVYKLAFLLLDKKQVPQAITWFRKAAEAGHGPSCSILAELYQETGDSKEALTWHLRTAELPKTELSYLLAYRTAGLACLQGEGIERDYARAARFLSIAAGYGDPVSQYYLGLMYMNGDGVPGKDAGVARYWLKLSATQGVKQAAEALEKL